MKKMWFEPILNQWTNSFIYHRNSAKNISFVSKKIVCIIEFVWPANMSTLLNTKYYVRMYVFCCGYISLSQLGFLISFYLFFYLFMGIYILSWFFFIHSVSYCWQGVSRNRDNDHVKNTMEFNCDIQRYIGLTFILHVYWSQEHIYCCCCCYYYWYGF